MSVEKQIEDITSHIRKNAHIYFTEFNPRHIQVTNISTLDKQYATLLRYAITDTNIERNVVAKIHHCVETTDSPMDRPRRFFIPHNEKHSLYANILEEIESLMKQKDDDRFGFIRMLDTLPQLRTVIMTEVQGNDLRRPFLQHNRLQSFFSNLDSQKIFFNIGEWLAIFHSLEPTDYVVAQATEINTLRDDIGKIINYLETYSNQIPNLRRAEDILDHYMTNNLTGDIPTGRMHGDFALRNILLNEEQRIVVLDTLGKWHTPIYEDIAYFLIRLWTNRLQALTLGYAYDPDWIKQCEQSFLDGYFGSEPIPTQTIVFYKIVMLLDQWASITELLTIKSKKRSVKIRFQLTNMYYNQLLNNYLEQLS